jgi:hypothetical protein
MLTLELFSEKYATPNNAKPTKTGNVPSKNLSALGNPRCNADIYTTSIPSINSIKTQGSSEKRPPLDTKTVYFLSNSR